MTPRSRTIWIECAVVVTLFAVALFASLAAMRGFRAGGAKPFFYQSNFEPAVMMACGRGFATLPVAPPALTEFLNVTTDQFDCSLLPTGTALRPLVAPANANWYYLYGATAGVWRVTGVSWTRLDVLVCGMSAVSAVLLYGLFRLIAAPVIAVLVALLLTLSPANLSHLLSLRDYSKAPFVLAAVLILATLILRPMRRTAVLAMAAAYGAVVAIGYGFRGDLAVMVPFGALVVFALLPGPFRINLVRNSAATAILLVTFGLLAWPVIAGLELGGCQYHFSLLGLTEPLTTELRLTPSIYRFGDHLTDTFADLKTGDYSARVLGAGVPRLCSPGYDVASRGLYFELARTFPADLVVRAYASVLMILRVGLGLPAAMVPAAPFADAAIVTMAYRAVSTVTSAGAAFGVVVTLAVAGATWATSVRLGIAFTLFVLFLAGYPAIRFEERHWFHLRFIPWWALVLAATSLLSMGARLWNRRFVTRAFLATAMLVAVLAGALGVIRVVQERRIENLVAAYLSAPTEPLQVRAVDDATIRVDWQPRDVAQPPFHRGSDLIVLTLEAAACAGAGPVMLTTIYDADVASHDLSTRIEVPRPAAAGPTRVFVPVFMQGLADLTELRFSGIRISGSPVACVTEVARVADVSKLALWLEMQVAPDWANRALYQSMRLPSVFNR